MLPARPAQIEELVQKTLTEFKKHTFVANYHERLEVKMKALRDAGTIPQSLKVGIPKLTVKDDEAHGLLTSTFKEIQNTANKQFLEAYIFSICKAKENAKAAVNATTVQFQEILKKLCETLSSVHFLGGLNATSLASKWMNEALAEYEQHCNNFLIEKAIKDAISQSAEAERQRAVDTAMQEAD